MERPTRARGRSGAVWSLAWRNCRASPQENLLLEGLRPLAFRISH